MAAKQTEGKITALYERLSRDDDLTGDSSDQNSNEFAPFLNIMNEWYLRDLSRKHSNRRNQNTTNRNGDYSGSALFVRSHYSFQIRLR